MADRPVVLYIDQADLDAYEALKKEDMFSEQSNARMFLLALSVGYSNGLRVPLSSRTSFVRTEYLKDGEVALLDCLAISVAGGAEVLMDAHQTHKIAEEYAHGGVQELLRSVRSTEYGSYDLVFETQTQTLQRQNSGTVLR